MAQTQIKAPAAEKTTAPAPVAPATSESPKAAPAPKTDRKTVGGPAYDRLVAAGASLVVLPSKGKLFGVLSGIGPVVSATDLPAKMKSATKNWEQFDRGYVTGPAASYSACAVNSGSKKAKGQPAFVFAKRDGDTVSLFTADGNAWDRPAKGEREQGVYDTALKIAGEALTA